MRIFCTTDLLCKKLNFRFLGKSTNVQKVWEINTANRQDSGVCDAEILINFQIILFYVRLNNPQKCDVPNFYFPKRDTLYILTSFYSPFVSGYHHNIIGGLHIYLLVPTRRYLMFSDIFGILSLQKKTLTFTLYTQLLEFLDGFFYYRRKKKHK